MRYFRKTKQKYYCPTVNVDRLWRLVSEQTLQVYKDRKDGKVPIIDVVRAVSTAYDNYICVMTVLSVKLYHFISCNYITNIFIPFW